VDRVETVDRREIDHHLEIRPHPTIEFDQEVGPASDDASSGSVLGEQLEGVFEADRPDVTSRTVGRLLDVVELEWRWHIHAFPSSWRGVRWKSLFTL
jgi:hypothetical protein